MKLLHDRSKSSSKEGTKLMNYKQNGNVKQQKTTENQPNLEKPITVFQTNWFERIFWGHNYEAESYFKSLQKWKGKKQRGGWGGWGGEKCLRNVANTWDYPPVILFVDKQLFGMGLVEKLKHINKTTSTNCNSSTALTFSYLWAVLSKYHSSPTRHKIKGFDKKRSHYRSSYLN